jgi:hypothetical protein
VLTDIFEMTQTDAVIERVEVVHGNVPDHVLFRATSEVRVREGEVASYGWCGRMMDVNVGEIVLVMENGPGEFVAYPKRLATPDLAVQMQRYEQ